MFTRKIHSLSVDKPFYLCLILVTISIIIRLICIFNLNLLVEEAYYWNYAQHLDFGYLDHPPMVALLIKLSTLLGGINEWSVRLSSVFCWMITAWYSFKLSEIILKGTGKYAVVLLSILPFFFIQSIVITPDDPLLSCWAAALYYGYRASVLDEAISWYGVGIAIGLGLLSKYTIVLVGVALVLHVLIMPHARINLTKKEPYFAVLIAFLLFSPVIYWNYTHQWISFIFQSSRRFSTITSLDLPSALGLVILFITPVGVWQLAKLIDRKQHGPITYKSLCFIRLLTCIPLGFFLIYSLNHKVNYNWMGPLFLASIPWFAVQCYELKQAKKAWFITAVIMLSCYVFIILVARFNSSPIIQQKFYRKIINWQQLVHQLNSVAQKLEQDKDIAPVFVPLDNYALGSEISYYQANLLAHNQISSSYSVIGAHIFGLESLMYRYWSIDPFVNRPIILVSKELWRLQHDLVIRKIKNVSPVNTIYATGQGSGLQGVPYFYQIVQYNGS